MQANPRVFRIVEAGERLVVDLPLARNPEAFRKHTGVLPDSLRYELGFLRQGVLSVVLAGDVVDCGFTADLRDREGGVYLVSMIGQTTGGEDVLFWKQHVFIQPRLRRSAEHIHELAIRHAPAFLFSRGEEYFPLSLSYLLENPVLTAEGAGEQGVDTPRGRLKVPAAELAEFLRYNGHADYLLNQSFLSFDESVFREIRGSFRRSVIYYSYLEDRDNDRFYINYHTFYAYDPKTGIAKMLNIGPHVFDRESMTIAFNGDEEPMDLILSGHLENQPILFLDKLKIWNTARVRVKFADRHTPMVHGHPIVPVAEGSHALYPSAGMYHISVLTEIAGHIFRRILKIDNETDDSEEPPGMAEHQVLLPPTLTSERFANYELRPLRLDLLRSDPLPVSELYDPATAVLVFSGYWVDVPGLRNERFPPFSRREQDIEDWVDGAYNWEWKDLPANVKEHNQAIADYIAGSLD